MEEIRKKEFILFLEDSFNGEVCFRELRLSKKELELLKKEYPNASLKKMAANQCDDGKNWYKVKL